MNFFNNMGDILGLIVGSVLWFFFDLFDSFIPAVFILVLIIKAISFPFDLKSRKSMLKTANISAKSQEIQKKYANNKQKMNEEMAKLYEQEGFNPLGGCLPMFLPALIFGGMYGAIFRPLTNLFHVSAETLGSALDVLRSIPGISGSFNSSYAQLELIQIFPQVSDKLTMFTPEQISDIMDFNKGFNFFGLDLFAVPVSSPFTSFAWIWPVLSTVTMLLLTFISQKLNSNSVQQPIGCAKFMPYIIPVVFVALTLYAPAALGVYYTIMNLVSIIQNVLMNKFFGPKTLAAKEEAARIARLELIEANEPKINNSKKINSNLTKKNNKI